jgi:hypothetical protein
VDAVDEVRNLRKDLERRDARARRSLRNVLDGRTRERGGHLALATFCEEVGEFALAIREYGLVLRDDPSDETALARLPVLHEESGHPDRAVRAARSWAARRETSPDAWRALVTLLMSAGRAEEARKIVTEGASRGWSDPLKAELQAIADAVQDEPEPDPAGDSEELADADVVRFVHTFAGRENVHARQWWNERGEGGYTPVREPLTVRHARNHLLGTETLGVYPIRLDDTVTFLALDFDVNKKALERAGRSMAEVRRLKAEVAAESNRWRDFLAERGVRTLEEDSGYKGRHLWVLLKVPQPASIARAFGLALAAVRPVKTADLHVEFFPKQEKAGAGLGNLIKLPLGIHRRTGRRCPFLLEDGTPDPRPHETLRAHPRLDEATLHRAILELRKRAGSAATIRNSIPAAEEPVESRRGQASVKRVPEEGRSREVERILRGCAVLRALRDRASERRRLSYDERVVLVHALGHSREGAEEVNRLFRGCVDSSANSILETPLSGYPVSCAKIRKRLPSLTDSLPCHCFFAYVLDEYPNPRLHLRDAIENRGPKGKKGEST